jgi:hypothetical protein
MTAPRADWLTIAQVCADLQVSETEWDAWRQAGDTPLHVVMPDGQLRVRAADYARWLDGLTDDAPQGRTQARTRTEPDPYGDPYAYGNPAGWAPSRPLPAYWRQRIRDAIDATGDRGLGRAEIWALTNDAFSLRQINDALAELLASQAYEEITVRTGERGRPPIRYRRRQPSHAAGNAASVGERRDASRAARADASRRTAAERDGQR